MAITIPVGEEPLWPMEGTGDSTKLWLFDPKQDAFFCFEIEHQNIPARAYRRNAKEWLCLSLEPETKWESVSSPETARLLQAMSEAVTVRREQR